MPTPPRVEPEESSIRSRNSSSHVAAARKKVTADDGDEDDEKETICTLIVKELDPRSIIQWPRLFIRSLIRTAQVLATVRFIKLGDVIAGIVNTALLFTFAAVFSSGKRTIYKFFFELQTLN